MVEEYGSELTSGMGSRSIQNYGRLSNRLLACMDRISGLQEAPDQLLEELREKIQSNSFNLVVVGQFKRGKTMLINALLGASLLPVAVVPLTSIVTILKFGASLEVRVIFNDGRTTEIEPERLPAFVTETENPHNVKEVKEVVVNYPSPYLKDGVRLIDTPGVGSVYQHNTDVAYQYLPKSDAALFLLSVEQPVSKAEIEFLKDVRVYADRIFFLLNKIDYFSEREIAESIAFSRSIIEDTMGSAVKVFPISAKQALEGQLTSSEELLCQSRLPSFAEVLNKFLMDEKGKVLLLSVSGHLLRMVAQSRLELELELKSLTTPLDELGVKVEAFEVKKREILTEKQNFGIMLDGEVDRLVKTGLDADLTSFKEALTSEMEVRFDAFYRENKDLSLKELNDALEAFVVGEVEKAFTTWRLAEDEKLAGAFGLVCERFRSKMDEGVDELLRFSSQLFAVPFEPAGAESLWSSKADFYYKFKEEAVGLDMLATSITQVLPRFIGDRFQKLKAYVLRMANRRILQKRKEHMLETIEMQAGRLRFDFLDRLNKGKQKIREEMLRRIEATVSSISAAIEKGLSLRARSEKEMTARLSLLSDRLLQLDEIREDLASLRSDANNL